MNSIIDKIIMIILAVITVTIYSNPINAIFLILLVITLSSILEYIDSDKVSVAVFCGYCIMCCFVPTCIYLFPVLFYDLFLTKYKYFAFSGVVPYIINLHKFSALSLTIILMAIATCYLLKIKTRRYNKVHSDYITNRDTLTEMSISLEKKVESILETQDYDVNLATLNERNRIAREIHDNVGHLLSSSILQLGAIMAIAKDETVKTLLNTLKDTLGKGMDSIRSSVHDLRDDSIDLYVQLNQLVKDFTFCEIELVYEIGDTLDIKSKYAIIAIVKEALANIIKHSNATKVTISLYEHPKLYQLIIYDNGKTNNSVIETTGMGLENIKQRVNSLNGIVNFDNSNGFRIFISFRKLK